MNAQLEPRFDPLELGDVRSVLARNTVGRIAFIRSGEIEVRPIHYVYFDGKIYGRTSPKAEIARLEESTRIAFEVDEVSSIFSWKSVIVHGSLKTISGTGPDAGEWEKAVELLRRIIRESFDTGDPVPERSVIFRIEIDEVTGRASSHG